MDTSLRGYARLLAAQPSGACAEVVIIEADLSRGLHSFSIVGLAGKAVEEARDRISSAIRHAGYSPPKAINKRIVLSLSPASLRKEGSQYDLSLAVAYLIAAGEARTPTSPTLFAGELGLDGSVRAVRGLLAQLLAARSAGITHAYVPSVNAVEASLLADDIHIFPVDTLQQVLQQLAGMPGIYQLQKECRPAPSRASIDIADIQGQEGAKRALEIAAAGRHNIVLYGPPGTGKTMLAQSLPGILPLLSDSEMLEATAIHSIAGELRNGDSLNWPPFRAPHHTISTSSLVGGGNHPRAGEVTLAHTGVLFLDELPQFSTASLQALREPLENREVNIIRSHHSVTFPANCMVIAAMNPPEVNGDDAAYLREHQKQSRKLSRPLMERFDLWVEVPHILNVSLLDPVGRESSKDVRDRVQRARSVSAKRTGKENMNNACLTQDLLRRVGNILPEAERVLQHVSEKLHLSPRSYHRTLRVARTIADLAQVEHVTETHVLEALQYRPQAI